jgi:hypothetical protein
MYYRSGIGIGGAAKSCLTGDTVHSSSCVTLYVMVLYRLTGVIVLASLTNFECRGALFASQRVSFNNLTTLQRRTQRAFNVVTSSGTRMSYLV